MTWNTCLYWYSQERGGTCFTQTEEEDDAVLLLDDPKGPVVIRQVVVSTSQARVWYDAVASGNVTLERPSTR